MRLNVAAHAYSATPKFACEIDPDCTRGPRKTSDDHHKHYTGCHEELLAILRDGEEQRAKNGTGTLKCEFDENCPNGPLTASGDRAVHYRTKHAAEMAVAS